jgi:hydroxymethylpyrimidine pyrophosphatase-like HAD family hydrolase
VSEAPIYVCDLDGTLLRPDATLSEFSRDGLNRLIDAGVAVTVGWTETTVQHRAADKGAAIPALLTACGGARRPVVACGDHLNDLPLFAVASRSVAPANAHPDVLRVATEVVGPNDEDGIVRYMLDCHLGSAV